MTLRIPSDKQFEKVIKNFESVLPLARYDSQLDIHNIYVCDEDHECGTVHCVGGWYAVANQNNPRIKAAIKRKDAEYELGADLMSKHLGFRNADDLVDWAHNNPVIWGNDWGGDLFGSIAAWNDAKNLKGIVKHLKEVCQRAAIIRANKKLFSFLEDLRLC